MPDISTLVSTADAIAGGIALIFIILDVLSGILAAAVAGNISSTVMRTGIYRKLALVLILVVASLVDLAELYLPLGFDTPVYMAAVVYIILMELASILENIESINPSLAGNGIFGLLTPHHQSS